MPQQGSERWLQIGPATIGLILLNIIVFVVLTAQPELVDVLGLPKGWDAVAQQPWTVVTVMFTSGHLIHVAGAVGCVLFLGGAVERRLGSAHLLGIYLLAGVTGSIAIATATSAGAGDAEVSVGASAALLGLLGALAGRPPTALTARLHLPKIVVVVLLVNLVQPMVGIGHWTSSLAHVGGIAVGALYGYALRTRDPTTEAVHAPSGSTEPTRTGRP